LTNALSTFPLPTWQQDLKRAITDPDELLRILDLDAALSAPARVASSAFGLRVTRSYLSRMRRGDASDPLLRQVLPLADELLETPGYGADPLLEHESTRAPGLLQKYEGRALLITTQACAIHCRYCFRREFPYSAQAEAAEEGATRFRAALGEIAADTSIEEIILSGGDPLSLSDARLTKITDAIAGIRHVQRIRVHTRQPIVLPSRVDDGLISWLQGIQRPTVFVLHTNHPNELDSEVRAACAKLRRAGVTLLNQSVLLRGVNDDVDTLADLSRALMDAGVVPYYLHLLDRVRGTAHFDVAEAEAQRLVEALSIRLSGYLVPRLVREVPGAPYKVPSVSSA
jgi:EF-P beta-lysylation protein EpmB